MIVGLFETRFLWPVIVIVLVRRVTRPVAARRQDLADEQSLGDRIAKWNVASIPAIGPLPASLVLAVRSALA